MKFLFPLKRLLQVGRWLVGAMMLGGLAWIGVREWRDRQGWESTDNAYLDGPVHPLAARLIGTVEQVMVQENSRVKEGDVLIRLDPRDARMRRQQSEAKLVEAEQSLAAAEAEAERAKADVRLDEVSLEKARVDLARMRALTTGGRAAVAMQELEHAQSALDSALASVAASESAVRVAEAAISVARAKKSSARVALEEAMLQCEYTTIHAPVDGRVGRRNVEAGQPVIPAQPLLALVGDDLWLTANFKETQIARIRPGQSARIRFDAFPDREWPGTVESLSPASGSRFALLPPDNATGNFTRVVQRVPVRIRLDVSTLRELGGKLVPGLSAELRVRLTGELKSGIAPREEPALTRR